MSDLTESDRLAHPVAPDTRQPADGETPRRRRLANLRPGGGSTDVHEKRFGIDHDGGEAVGTDHHVGATGTRRPLRRDHGCGGRAGRQHLAKLGECGRPNHVAGGEPGVPDARDELTAQCLLHAGESRRAA